MSEREISLQPPRGMRDFYPEDATQQAALFDAWKKQAELFGFDMYDAPVVESLDLIKRKSGEEIVDQIYAFEDKSGRELALRPEMTPTLARLVLGRRGELSFPIRWSSIPQCFRYERSSTGRRREHYQWNADIIGEASVAADAEVVALAVSSLEKLGLTSDEVSVRFNNRGLLSDLLENGNIDQSMHSAIFLALDKRGKISDQEMFGIIQDEAGVSQDQLDYIAKILGINSLEEVKSILPENTPSVDQTEEFLRYCKLLGIDRYVDFDLGIVRGLSYYTGTVFEAFDRDRKFRAIFGGGRYDNLFKTMGGLDLPAVGFGFGDVVIRDVIEYYGKKIPTPDKQRATVVFTDEGVEDQAYMVANRNRANGVPTVIRHNPGKFKQGIKYATDRNSDTLIILDPRETAQGVYIEKDLNTGNQETHDL